MSFFPGNPPQLFLELPRGIRVPLPNRRAILDFGISPYVLQQVNRNGLYRYRSGFRAGWIVYRNHRYAPAQKLRAQAAASFRTLRRFLRDG